MVAHGARCVETWIEHGVDTAMNRYNRRPAPPPKPGRTRAGRRIGLTAAAGSIIFIC